jgi:hypothetical protein
MKAYPRPTVLPHPRDLHPARADACLDFALRAIAVADNRLPTRAIPAVGILA